MVKDLGPTGLGLEPFWEIGKLFGPSLLQSCQRLSSLTNVASQSLESRNGAGRLHAVAIRPCGFPHSYNWFKGKFETIAAELNIRNRLCRKCDPRMEVRRDKYATYRFLVLLANDSHVSQELRERLRHGRSRL